MFWRQPEPYVHAAPSRRKLLADQILAQRPQKLGSALVRRISRLHLRLALCENTPLLAGCGSRAVTSGELAPCAGVPGSCPPRAAACATQVGSELRKSAVPTTPGCTARLRTPLGARRVLSATKNRMLAVLLWPYAASGT